MRLLLAIDGSTCSEAATQVVSSQAKPGTNEVRVVHVVDTMRDAFPEMTWCEAEIERAPNPRRQPAEALVERTAAVLRAKGLNATTAVEWGDPKSKIIDAAREWHADLIVVGSHGWKGLDRFLMGSVSDAVARYASCSVEVIRTTNPRDRIVRVLLAVDDSKFSDAAANAVLAQVKANDTEVRLLRVLEPFPVVLAESMGSKDNPNFACARLKLRDEAAEQLTMIAKKLGSAGFKTSQFLEEGDPRDTILDYAEQWPANLIVVGSHGRKGVKRFLMGSVSEAVARYAECSVEIVRIQPAD